MTRMDVSVIIVNYNTRRLLSACVDSIRARTKDVSYEIIVVDNASSDGSREMLLERYPEVRLVANTENLGFGEANNRGARSAKGSHLFFLNSDTVFLNNALKEFLDFSLAARGRVGAVGCLLSKGDGRLSNSWGDFPTYSTLLWYRLGYLISRRSPRPPAPGAREAAVDFVTGADLFMEKAVFESVGGFDRLFFLYYEETDLQKRLARQGYRNYILAAPRIAHLEGGSVNQRMRARIMQEDSMYKYFAKHRGRGAGLWAFYLAYSLTSFLSIPKYRAEENLAYFRNVFSGIPRILAGR
jgi:hypothetical protein